MSNSNIPQLIGDVVLREPSEEERTRAAVDIISYGLAALVTLQGPEKAAETAYRCADAVVRRIA